MPIKPRNIFVLPEARIVSLEPTAGGGVTMRLQVDGMVCDI